MKVAKDNGKRKELVRLKKLQTKIKKLNKGGGGAGTAGAPPCQCQYCVHCLMDSITKDGGGDGCECSKVALWLSSCNISLKIKDMAALLSDSELNAYVR